METQGEVTLKGEVMKSKLHFVSNRVGLKFLSKKIKRSSIENCREISAVLD